MKDVPTTTGCAAGQEVLPDGENQTSGEQDLPAEEPAALRYRETEGHSRGCQEGPQQGDSITVNSTWYISIVCEPVIEPVVISYSYY